MIFNILFVTYFILSGYAIYRMYKYLTFHCVDENADFYGVYADPEELDSLDLEKEKWDDYYRDIASGLNLNGN